MNYDVKLYAHGVPKGQSTWGVSEYDSNYIESFYGRKSDVPVQMLVEVKQFGDNTNCYYTYFRTANVNDSSGRAGSYFALTLRLNYYYADTQNMYNLLDAAYNKFIVGSRAILATANGVSKYLISDFIYSESILTALDQEIQRYLMQFSVDSDFIPLNGFKVNGLDEVYNVNLLECDIKVIAGHVKAYSNISVSPFYSSVREQKAIQRMKDKIAAVNNNAEQQIMAVKQNAQAEIQNIQDEAEQNIKAAQREKEERIQAIKNEYKDADRTISMLQQRISKNQEKIGELQNNLSILQDKLDSTMQYRTKYEDVKRELDEANKIVGGVQNYLVKLNELVNSVGRDEVSNSPLDNQKSENNKNPVNSSNSRENSFMFKRFIKKSCPFIILLILVVISVKGCSTDNHLNKELSVVQEKIEGLGQELKEIKKLLNDARAMSNNTVMQEDLILKNIRGMYGDVKIDVKGISPQKPMKTNTKYTVRLLNVGELNGKWVSDDFDIIGDKIKPKHVGECIISYELDGVIIASRKINVER